MVKTQKKQLKKGIHMNINMKITVLIFSFCFLVIFIKMAYVGLSNNVDGTDLTKFADSRNTTSQTLYASRGSIYDKNGDELAKSVKSYTVIAFLSDTRTNNLNNPQHVVDKENTATLLAPIINMTAESILKLLNQNLYQVELGPGGRGITEDTKKQIEKLDLPGIGFTSSTKRFYKNKNYASYLVGYARRNDEGELNGEMGIESYFNNDLKGTNGNTKYQKDAYGYQIPNTPSYTTEAERGSDVYLTIDNNVQFILENVMNKLATEHRLDWAQFSIMDAKTGEVIGSATNPNFDLNTLDGITSYMNPLTSYQYEPGSTMKIFSFMAAIENGIYHGDETYHSGTITLKDGTRIKDWNNTGWGDISYNKGFAYSSNVAATKLSLELGVGKLRDFYELCGFGKKTEITLPGEENGVINFNYESELANASFGQGISITPIQMLQALSSFANDGVMVKPFIVSKIVDSNGKNSFTGEKEVLNRIASVETMNQMKQLMYDVVYNNSDNKGYAPDNITIAGKTGTAEIPSPNGGYESGMYDYIKSFSGFFPYEDPKYVFYFSTKRLVASSTDIKKVISSAIGEIAKVTNLAVNHSDVDESKIVQMSNYISNTVDQTLLDIKKNNLMGIFLGSGKYVINQYPLKQEKVLQGSKVFILTNSSEYKMPDVTGWSTNDMIRFCNFIDLPYHLNGYGIVKSTSLATNDAIDVNVPLEINLGI